MTPEDELIERCQPPMSPSDYPGWNYRRCRCENNGDYCDYCLSIIEAVDAESILADEHTEEI
jgi:hypothetical protein